MTRGPDAAALNNLADAVVGQLPRMLADVYALLEARDADYAAFLAAEYDEVLGAAGHFVRRLFGTRARPMSPAAASVSSPVRNTVAARASEASSACALSVATPMRSQSAATAAARWPCAASHAPKLCSSVAGPAGSTARSVSAAATARARWATGSGW